MTKELIIGCLFILEGFFVSCLTFLILYSLSTFFEGRSMPTAKSFLKGCFNYGIWLLFFYVVGCTFTHGAHVYIGSGQ